MPDLMARTPCSARHCLEGGTAADGVFGCPQYCTQSRVDGAAGQVAVGPRKSMIQRRSVIAKSNQVWKAALGVLFLIGGGLADAIVTLIAYSHGPLANNGQLYNVQAASTVLAMLGFAYLCTQIRCPQCGAKWIWMGVTGKLNPKSVGAILTLDRCPKCGYAGLDRAGGTRP